FEKRTFELRCNCGGGGAWLMRVLVTGATGFVGHHLLDLLVSDHHLVFGTFLQRDFGSLPKGVTLLHCDLKQSGEVRRILQDVRPQQIYHLAALSSVRGSFEDAKSVYETNFWGTLSLLEATRVAQPSARVLLVGSGQCYGRVKPGHLPVGETEL